MISQNKYNIKVSKIGKENLIIIVDGNKHSFNLKDISLRLYNAIDSERFNFVISPSGYGIHWPL